MCDYRPLRRLEEKSGIPVRRPSFVRYKQKNGIWYLWVPAKLFVPFPPKLFHFSNDSSSFSMWFIRQSLFLLCVCYSVRIMFFIHSLILCVPSIMEFPLEDFHPHTSTLCFAHSFAHTRPNISFFYIYIYSAPFAQATVYRMSQKLWFHKKFTQYAWTQDLIAGVSVLAYDSVGGAGWIWFKRQQRRLIEVSPFLKSISVGKMSKQSTV